jgi:hypothetical protein
VLPVPTDLAERQLPALIESYVQSLSGGNYESFKIETNRAVGRDKRFAATLVAVQPCHIADVECQLATVDIADVDQLKLSPAARTRRIQVLLARTRFEYDFVYAKFPGFLMVGYSNQPARFDAELGDYHQLLTRIDIRGKTGLQVEPATQPVTATPTGAATPAAPAAPTAPPP